MKIRFLIAAAASILLFGGCAGDAFVGPYDGPYLGGVGGWYGGHHFYGHHFAASHFHGGGFHAVDFTAEGLTAVAGTGRREEEITNGKSEIAN
ncbi:MAG: hypothetical protein QOI53_2140 [Verrucomicrobiota bacterium]|nr:hypothetical protein [Verrucomicrobiota bacterium]